jgi:membrane protein
MTEEIVRFARWPALIAAMLLGLSVLYRYGPSRHAAKWQWISLGAVFATLTWFAGSAALSYYFANFANYNATYGSLGAAVGTMMWMWMSAIVVLFGAELNSEIEHQTARDTTIGAEKPLGARGATMADTVGAAQ